MDYVVGSISALVSGNVTPNRPRLVKKATTPTKRPHSPNVTPKSEFVNDRSIFLSPSLQKKKAIVKKSPKRIFQNPDLDVTNEENDNKLLSPKGEKAKKHLKKQLEDENISVSMEVKTPSKKKKHGEVNSDLSVSPSPSKKKNKIHLEQNSETQNKKQETISTPSKKRKSLVLEPPNTNEDEQNTDLQEPANKKKKKKMKKQQKGLVDIDNATSLNTLEDTTEPPKVKKSKISVNPNAVTHKDSDSEHESDYEIESENEVHNNEVLNENDDQANSSSDEEEIQKENTTPKDVVEKKITNTADDAKRTIFVGNVPFSKKCKKEIKKIFGKFGQIDTVRIRTVPVKDARVTPKLAIIRNELHPDRTTVNVYVKFVDVESVGKALSANNTVYNEHHLRVSRSDHSGDDVDPKCAIFVGNVPFGIEDEVLRSKFEKCGDIDSVRVVRDRKTNAGKGFAFVNFKSKDGVELALSLTEEDLTIKNRIMRVKRCSQMAKNQKRPGKFGAKPDLKRNQKQIKFDPKGGAYQRIKNKKKMLESGNEEPSKNTSNTNQPQREKKQRKEFVGVTSEKKKKRKFDKNQKKKKAISEILTK